MKNIDLKILYVDDEEENLFSFKSVFRRFFRVKTAQSGEQAIELMSEENFDIVLSDQRMPQMTGVELCQYISEHFPETKRYIVTGYSEMSTINEAIDEGIIVSVIRKPWEIQEIRSLVEG